MSLLCCCRCLLGSRNPKRGHCRADPNRCDRGYVGNTIGQANAVSDRVLDLRKCVYKGADLSAKVLSGALMSEADFSGTTMRVRTFL